MNKIFSIFVLFILIVGLGSVGAVCADNESGNGSMNDSESVNLSDYVSDEDLDVCISDSVTMITSDGPVTIPTEYVCIWALVQGVSNYVDNDDLANYLDEYLYECVDGYIASLSFDDLSVDEKKNVLYYYAIKQGIISSPFDDTLRFPYYGQDVDPDNCYYFEYYGYIPKFLVSYDPINGPHMYGPMGGTIYLEKSPKYNLIYNFLAKIKRG